jgi:hypothetical protein
MAQVRSLLLFMIAMIIRSNNLTLANFIVYYLQKQGKSVEEKVKGVEEKVKSVEEKVRGFLGRMKMVELAALAEELGLTDDVRDLKTPQKIDFILPAYIPLHLKNQENDRLRKEREDELRMSSLTDPALIAKAVDKKLLPYWQGKCKERGLPTDGKKKQQLYESWCASLLAERHRGGFFTHGKGDILYERARCQGRQEAAPNCRANINSSIA